MLSTRNQALSNGPLKKVRNPHRGVVNLKTPIREAPRAKRKQWRRANRFIRTFNTTAGQNTVFQTQLLGKML